MAMDPVTLTFGGREVTLSRSENLIALRARPGDEAKVERTLGAVPGPAGRSATLGEPLGGFRIVELADMPPERADHQLDVLRAEPEVQVGTHVFHMGPDQKAPMVPTGEIYVKFHPESGDEVRQAVLDAYHLRVVGGRDPNALVLRTTPQSPNPVTTAARLQSHPAVAVAEPELAVGIERRDFTLPPDTLLADQWHLHNTGRFGGTPLGGTAGADARVVKAWRALGNLGSEEVIVAVIDDGFDPDHPDLKDKMVSPRDFTRLSEEPWPGDRDWHGTACAGVAVASAGSGAVIGAAPRARLMPVRWGPDLRDSEVEAWFDHVTSHGAWVVSCSWGAAAPFFPLSTRITDAIHRCATRGRGGKGCVVVFAAGNDNRDVHDPSGRTLDGFAIHPDVIAVAASSSRDRRAEYSNFGDAIWVCAPSNSDHGWGVLTADVTDGKGRRGYGIGDYTWSFGGTSSACPLVAGIAALVLGANPDLTAREVRRILADTARRIGAPADYQGDHSRFFGHGCVDAEAAVRMAMQLRGLPIV